MGFADPRIAAVSRMYAKIDIVEHGGVAITTLEVMVWQTNSDTPSTVVFSGRRNVYEQFVAIAAAINAAFPELEAKP